MPENDFEKKVQDKMDGFNLSPSADLWNKVESRIRKEKKRRFIWWPLGLLLLGGGIGLAIWLTNNNSNNQSIPVSENKSINTGTNTLPSENANIDKSNKDSAVSNLKDPEPTIQEKNDNLTGKIVSKIDKTLQITGSKRVPVKKLPELNKEVVTEEKKDLPVQSKQLADASKELPGQNKDLVEEKKITEPLKETVSETSEEKKPVAEDKKIKIQKVKQWGLGISAGGSAIVSNLGLGGSRDFYSAAPVTPAQLSSYRSPRASRSFSFSAQVFRKHRLSPRLDLIGAMGYQYLSTRLLIGERVDSARLINNYYSPNRAVSRFYRQPGYGNTGMYTNQFHFITLSGELSWRFTGEKTNIRWNNGLSYDRLISSSFLHYDGAIQGYYKDNKRLAKNHIFFNTALSIPVGKKFQLQPFASQSMTSVFNARDSAASTFSNFGLRVRYLFDKRK